VAAKSKVDFINNAPDRFSPKVLAARLRMLQGEGLVTRKVYACVPPKTEYSLSPPGRDIERVIRGMAEFGTKLAQTT